MDHSNVSFNSFPAPLAISMSSSIEGGLWLQADSTLDRVPLGMFACLANATCVSDVVLRAERANSAAFSIAARVMVASAEGGALRAERPNTTAFPSATMCRLDKGLSCIIYTKIIDLIRL